MYTYDMFGKLQGAIISFIILVLSCPYLRLSAWNISVATRQISVQFDTRVIKIGPAIFFSRTAASVSLHEDISTKVSWKAVVPYLLNLAPGRICCRTHWMATLSSST
jgi:hypothetical protein